MVTINPERLIVVVLAETEQVSLDELRTIWQAVKKQAPNWDIDLTPSSIISSIKRLSPVIDHQEDSVKRGIEAKEYVDWASKQFSEQHWKDMAVAFGKFVRDATVEVVRLRQKRSGHQPLATNH